MKVLITLCLLFSFTNVFALRGGRGGGGGGDMHHVCVQEEYQTVVREQPSNISLQLPRVDAGDGGNGGDAGFIKIKTATDLNKTKIASIAFSGTGGIAGKNEGHGRITNQNKDAQNGVDGQDSIITMDSR